MRILPLKKSMSGQKTITHSRQSLRAFNIGPVNQTELSIWLEANFESDQLQTYPIKITIKNEGKKVASNFQLSIKTTSGITLVNHRNFFGTGSKSFKVDKLSVNKSITWIGQFKLNELADKAQVIAEITTKSRSGQVSKLLACLDLLRQVSRLGA